MFMGWATQQLSCRILCNIESRSVAKSSADHIIDYAGQYGFQVIHG